MVRKPPTFGGSSGDGQDPRREKATFPEPELEHSPKSNSLWPNWAKAKGNKSLRPTTVHTGTDLGPTGPKQGVRRKGRAFVAPRDCLFTAIATLPVQKATSNQSTLRDHQLTWSCELVRAGYGLEPKQPQT